MRRLNPVFIFLLAYALFLVLCAAFSEKGSVAVYYQGWDFSGEYTPTDEELGILAQDSVEEEW